RLPGVAGVDYLGQRDYSLRAWLDPDKLAALNLSAMDVVTSIAAQNIQVAAGQIGQRPVPAGQQFQLTVTTIGRLTEPEDFANIIIKGAQDTTQPSTGGATSGATAGTSGPTATGPTASTGTSPNNSATGIVRLRDVVARYE